MKCKNCGKRIRKKELFCNSCGFYNGDSNNISWNDGGDLLRDDKTPVVEKKEEKVIVKEEKPRYEDEDILEGYIGEDYKSISNSIFNIWAFLLSWVYFIYRKLYIIGYVGLFITLLMVIFLRRFLFIYLGVIMITSGFVFNPIYIMLAKTKIGIIKDQNQDSDRFTIINIAMEKGGTNLVIALISYLVFLVIVFFSVVSFSYNKNHNANFWQENSENQANCISIIKTAYNNLEEEYDLGSVSDAACKVLVSTTKEYEVYLRTIKDDKFIYSLYTTENNLLKYENNTERYNELETKKVNGTITPEENDLYNAIRNIESNYQDISIQSAKEEELIAKKQNKSERTNFIFSKEEIIR